MSNHKCTSCGSINSYTSNGDNQICRACGDTQGYREEEEERELETYYSTLTQSSLNPRGYLKIRATSEEEARIVSKAILGKNWSFIYPEEDFLPQIEKYGLHSIDQSPEIVPEGNIWYYKKKLKEQSE